MYSILLWTLRCKGSMPSMDDPNLTIELKGVGLGKLSSTTLAALKHVNDDEKVSNRSG
ncbi:hypothetical protein BofuT4_P029660.1 [Botrytis cinerea T4]|uniref:Uncharacterized protein n=1 Tax=Botryotinia fuckeliana (strain T4) TaxID=999810 RepID=G2Y914_BOTF4|nr:hypothetical protein BofuT4_P029660.1 [Botrytis cinerea T4]